MKFKDEFNTLVIAGQWNNAIFNPDWVTKYLIPETPLKVEIPVNINGSTRISNDELRLFTLDNKLNFTILKQSDEILNKIENLALKVVEYLPHTPSNAFGINFVFESEEVEKLKSCFSFSDSSELNDLGLKLEDSKIIRAFKKGGYLLTFMITKTNNGFIFDFNYHFEIKSLIELKGKIEEGSLIKYKNQALELLQNIYGLKLPNIYNGKKYKRYFNRN